MCKQNLVPAEQKNSQFCNPLTGKEYKFFSKSRFFKKSSKFFIIFISIHSLALLHRESFKIHQYTLIITTLNPCPAEYLEVFLKNTFLK